MNRREAIQRAALALGYAITGPALIGVLNGCKASPALTFTPTFFTPEQATLVAELTEILIPQTETPGAKAAGVPAFIDALLKETYPQQNKDHFIQELNAFNDEANTLYGNNFVNCTHEEQVALVKKHHDAVLTGNTEPGSIGWWRKGNNGKKPFILEVKELTILGFFTSEPGATQVLQYNPVPGPYKGCVPLKEIGKTWAT